MSDSTTETTGTTPAESTTTEKVSVATRREMAAAAFRDPTISATDAAALFSHVPNGREFLDATYNAVVAEIAAPEKFVSPTNPDGIDPATLGTLLAVPAVRREEIAAAMTTAPKASRGLDPVAARKLLVERLGTLTAVREHLASATEWVAAILAGIDPGDLTADESATVTAGTVPEKVAAATEKVRGIVEKTPRAATVSGERSPRTVVPHNVPAIGSVITGGGHNVNVIAGDGRDGRLYVTADGTAHKSVSGAAKALTGEKTEIDGWKYFGLK